MEDKVKIKLINMIKKLRKEQGLTQDDLGKRVGNNRANIARMEGLKYDMITYDYLFKCLEALGHQVKIEII